MLVVRRNETVEVSRGRKRVGVVRDVASGPPSTGWVTCDTKQCQRYLESVNKMVQQVSIEWQRAIDATAASPKDAGKLEEMTRLQQTWLRKDGEWRQSWQEFYKDCDSTFAGPCKNAIDFAAAYEKASLDEAATIQHWTKRDPGVKPVLGPEDAPPKKEKPGSSTNSLFSFNFGGIVPVLLLAGGAFLLTRK